jgi:serine/threonine-protein kinase
MLSHLLDQALELPEAEHEPWLERLAEPFLRLKPTLRALLARQRTPASHDFLSTLPTFTGAQAPAADAINPVGPDVDIGPYTLRQALGRGGMGTVWLAERTDGLVKRPVALKLPHIGLHGPQYAARFARERDCLAGLVHTNIARLYDAGITALGQPYLAMEYVEGVPLTDYAETHGLSVRSRLALFQQVLCAVQYAHTHLVVHRDLKPANILVTAGGDVKLLDFGIAKLVSNGEAPETELTQLAGRACTPHYASPEQIAGQPISTASDIYSLGIVLYELLTGTRPYKLTRDSRGALEDAILRADPPRPSQAVTDATRAPACGTTTKQLAKALRGDLDTIVLKALQKPPRQRYGTADAFAQDIERFLHGHAVLAQPDSVWYRGKKWLWRHKRATGAATAVVLALVGGTSLALWQAAHAREQARLATREARTAKAVQAFLEDIFRTNTVNQPNPRQARQTTARELLDIGAQKIEGALADAPVAKLKVLKTLAQMYDSLELRDKRIALLRQRVQLTRAVYGTKPRVVAAALVELGNAANRADLRTEAAHVLAEAAQLLDDSHDWTSLTRARLEVELARLYRVSALPQALAHADKGIHLLRAMPPSRHLLLALYIKAAICNTTGDYATAAATATEALALTRALVRPTNHLLPYVYRELGKAQSGLEDVAGAAEHLQQALQVAQTLTGADSLTTLQMAHTWGNFLRHTAHLRDSLAVLERATQVALQLAAAGDTSSNPPAAVLSYGRTLMAYGRVEAGLEVLQQVPAMRRQRELLPDIQASWCIQRAAGLIELGQYAEAQALLTEAATRLRELGRDQTPLAHAQVALQTALLLVTGRHDEASHTFEAFHVAGAPPDTVFRPQVGQQTTRAEIRLVQGDSAAALALASEAHEQITTSALRPSLTLLERRAALVMGQAYLRLGRPAEAVPLLTQAVAVSAAVFDPTSLVLADAYRVLAEGVLALGDHQQATTLLAQAQTVHAAHPEIGVHYTAPLRALAARLTTYP